ncbi:MULTISPECIES: hypothetical protein [unclassified Moorena]|uniref:hypothetical protein n=1 Tax=unclassified Moorena TaxID=2683338 RepID=UPI0013FE6503|nr:MULTISPECIES: hypothetical protein [unclassified Moorena]NEO17120.1 hypothetical protein [Moorena sp. SIO3E8]NEQ03399.1 hypothetical protein [Moorena sp. SIO3F7]
MLIPFWLAIAQWVVLRRYISDAWSWVVVTALGAYVAIPTMFFFYSWYITAQSIFVKDPSIRLPMTWKASILTTLIGCVVISIFQSVALSKHTTRAGWWIVLNSLVWTAFSSWIIEICAHDLMNDIRNYNDPRGYDYNITGEMVVTLIILIIPIASLIQGRILVWLFNSPKDPGDDI